MISRRAFLSAMSALGLSRALDLSALEPSLPAFINKDEAVLVGHSRLISTNGHVTGPAWIDRFGIEPEADEKKPDYLTCAEMKRGSNPAATIFRADVHSRGYFVWGAWDVNEAIVVPKGDYIELHMSHPRQTLIGYTRP